MTTEMTTEVTRMPQPTAYLSFDGNCAEIGRAHV